MLVCSCCVAQVTDKLTRLDTCTLKQLTLCANDSPPAEQLRQLQAALQVVCQLPCCRGTQVELHGFTLTPALATELVAVSAQGWCSLSLTELQWPSEAVPSMPQLPPLHTLSLATPITDTVLAQVCQWVTAVDTLSVAMNTGGLDRLTLTAPLPEGTAVPWRVLSLAGCLPPKAESLR